MLDIKYSQGTEFIVKVIPFCFTKTLEKNDATDNRDNPFKQYEGRIEIWVNKELTEEKKTINVYLSDNSDDTLEWHDFENLNDAKQFVEKWISEHQ